MAAIAYSNPSIAGPGSRTTAVDPARPDLRVVAGGRTRRVAHPTAATYRRRRLTVLVAVAVLVTVLVVTVRVLATGLGGGPNPAPEASVSAVPAAAVSVADGTAYIVQPGDTVWSIARRVKPEGDLRPLVDRIVARLGTTALRPGQTLYVG